MNPSGGIPMYLPPKPRGSAVKRPPSSSSSGQESELERAIREELSNCIHERDEYRKELSNVREELVQTRAVAQTLQSYFRSATGDQPDLQKIVFNYIQNLQEMERMRTALREEERKNREFIRVTQVQFKTQLLEKEAEIRANLQRQVDDIVAQEKQKRRDVQYELESWQKHAEALRARMLDMRTHYNNLVLQYEALRTRRTLRDITNAPDDDNQDENTGVVWMDLDALMIGAEEEEERDKKE